LAHPIPKFDMGTPWGMGVCFSAHPQLV
jgi:hypothetical protein